MANREMRTARAQMGDPAPTKPKTATGYRYRQGRRPDGTRPDPQAELRQAAAEIKHVVGARGHLPATSAVPEPQAIFPERQPETKLNAAGHYEAPAIFPDERPDPELSRWGAPVPRSAFDSTDT